MCGKEGKESDVKRGDKIKLVARLEQSLKVWKQGSVVVQVGKYVS